MSDTRHTCETESCPKCEKGILESAADKTKEMARDVKESVTGAYDRLTGNRAEDKMAKEVKDSADTCAKKATEARDYTAKKLEEASKTIAGH